MAVRLVLRSFRPSDVPTLLEWMPDRSMYKYWGKSAGKADKDPSLLFAHPEKPTKSFHWGIEYESKVVFAPLSYLCWRNANSLGKDSSDKARW